MEDKLDAVFAAPTTMNIHHIAGIQLRKCACGVDDQTTFVSIILLDQDGRATEINAYYKGDIHLEANTEIMVRSPRLKLVA